MQQPQLNNDAGFRFELWKKLLLDSLGSKGSRGKCPEWEYTTASISRVALPLVKSFLPRRLYEPCCLSGSCTTPSIPYLHRCVSLGRSQIETPEHCRDELCYCLAHSMACVGPISNLVVRGYRSSQGDMKDRFRGLRCLLRHARAARIEFSDVLGRRCSHGVIWELASLLRHPHLPQGCLEIHLIHCTPTPLEVRFFACHLQSYDCLTHLSLQNCQIEDLEDISEYVRSTRLLSHLSLRHTTNAQGWSVLAAAVAHAPTIVYLDVAHSGWGETPHFSQLVNSFTAFAPRECFTLDVSFNALSSKAWAVLVGASELFRQHLSALFIGGHFMKEDAEPVSQFFNVYPSLCSLSIAHCTFSSGNAQRLLRGLTDKNRAWQLIDITAVDLPPGAFRRICQTPFSNPSKAALLCSQVDLHGQLLKSQFVSCAAVLSRLDLSHCRLSEECIGQLASSFEKCAPLPLTYLSLCASVDPNAKKKGDGGFLFLCKALRSSGAPVLEYLDLSCNHLPLLSIVALVEQVSSTLRHLNLSYTPITDNTTDRVRVLTSLMRRQRGLSPFAVLDLHAVSSSHEPWLGLQEVMDWLLSQTKVRLMRGNA